MRDAAPPATGPSLGTPLRGSMPAREPPALVPRERPWIRLAPSVWRGGLSIILAGLLWEVAARTVVNNPLFFAPLSAVLARGLALWQSGSLQRDVLVSLQEFLLGFLLASVAGIVFGMLMASSEAIRDFLDPWVSMLYSTPTIALAPLLILWLGIGLLSHVAVVFLVVIFPVLINTFAGLSTTDDNLVQVARSFGADRGQIFTKVRFPSALPFIVAGLRNGVARGLVGVVVAELFGAKAGLGFLITVSAQTFDTAGLFVGVLLFALAGVVAVEVVKWFERRLAPWRFQATDE